MRRVAVHAGGLVQRSGCGQLVCDGRLRRRGGLQPLALAADKSFQLSHTYLDNGSYTVTVSVDDGHTSGSDSFQATVSNVAPSVQAGPDATLATGDTLSRPGSFDDPGSLDSWTATVNYGDGAGAQPLMLDLDKSFQLLHTYTSQGQYTLTVTVTDDDGDTGRDTATITVEAPPTFTLTVAATGSGSVTGPGIACPGDCTESYPVDTEVVLHAAADRARCSAAGAATAPGPATAA